MPKPSSIRAPRPTLHPPRRLTNPTRHVEARLTLDQGIALRRLLLALDKAGARLRDGRHVQKNPDAIRWLLEQVVEQVDR